MAVAPDGSGVGVARFVRTGPAEAEPAVVVADDWQGQGVGSLLMTRLAERALEEGITHFNAMVLASNPEAIAVLRGLGEASIERHGTEVEVRIPLEAPAAPPSALRALLRAVAQGTLDPALTLLQRLLPRREAGGERANVIVTALHQERDEAAVALTERLAAAADAEVVVVAAANPLLDDRGEAERRARRAGARLRAHDVSAREVVRAGDIAAVALDVASEEHARLIVVEDSAEKPDATARLLGEPWDHISHHAPCDVLVAR